MILYGIGFLIYGILICLDKIRMEKYEVSRGLIMSITIASGISMGIYKAKEGEFTFLSISMFLFVMLLFVHVVHRYRYNIFNLDKRYALVCIQRALNNENLDYSISNYKVTIKEACDIDVFDENGVANVQILNIKNEDKIRNIVKNIKSEVYNYKIPKQRIYSGGYVYMTIGVLSISVLMFIIYKIPL